MRRAVAGLALLLAAACGTTVSGVPARSSAQDGLGTGAGADGGTASLPGQSSSAVGGGPAGTTTGAVAAPTGPTSAPQAAGDVGGSSGAQGKRSPYLVGVAWSSDSDAALKSLGAQYTLGDVKGAGDAVAAWVNKHGGMGGRPLQLVWYDGSVSDSPSDLAQKSCVYWTQDHHVDAAIPAGSIVDMNVARQCLGKAHVPAVSGETHVQTRAAGFAGSPLWLEPLTFTMEGFALTYADSLARQGFFRGGRLGVVYDDGPEWTSVEKDVFEPELRRLGVQVVDRAGVQIRGAADSGSSQSALSEAVLRFRTSNVDRVVFLEPWDGYAFFMQQAESQKYRPTYGLSSQGAFVATWETGLVPAAQMTGAYYVGWSPLQDLSNLGSGWGRLNLCRTMLRQAGIAPSGRLALDSALIACDGILDLKALADRTQGGLDAGSFLGAVDAVSWEAAMLPTTAVRSSRRYGVTSVRAARWDATCQCFHYTSPPAAVHD
jgi:ABC-type branched-subunit amino acid transport system substrate-binding protein